MKLALSSRFQKQIRDLPESLVEELDVAARQVLECFGRPHLHQGLGIRKLHSQGVYEFRVGRRWRVIFTRPTKDVLMLHLMGDHRAVQHFLDSW